MARRTLLLAALFLAATGPAAAMQGAATRDLAMGGVGVASSQSFSTAFVNPALVRRVGVPREFAIVFPAARAIFEDEQDLRDGVSDLQDTLRDLRALVEAGDPAADALRPVAAQELSRLDGDDAFIDLGLEFGLVVPRETFTFGVALRRYLDVRFFAEVDDADFGTLANSTTPAEFDDLASEIVVPAAWVDEIGFTLAGEFELFGWPVSFGATPKFQSVQTSLYAASVSVADESDIRRDFDDVHDNEDSANVDVGLAVDVTRTVRAGLAVRNLVSHTFDGPTVEGRTIPYELEPLPTLGLAYDDDAWVVAVDVDLARTSRFEGLDDTQFLRVGLEHRGWSGIALRGGFVADMTGYAPDRWSLGVGFPGYVFDAFDVAAVIGENGIGGSLQFVWAF